MMKELYGQASTHTENPPEPLRHSPPIHYESVATQLFYGFYMSLRKLDWVAYICHNAMYNGIHNGMPPFLHLPC